MKYHISHITRYSYEDPVMQSINQCIMKPLHDATQQCLEYSFNISPHVKYYTHMDYWGNEVYIFYIWDSHTGLVVTSEATVEISSQMNRAHVLMEEEHADKRLTKAFQNDYAEYLTITDFTKAASDTLEAMTKPIWDQSRSLYDYVKSVNQYIYTNYTYQPVSTTVNTKVSEFLEMKCGVCQDYAHLMLALCRHKGIPARYVSGYIFSGIDDKAMRGSSATHAWVEVMLPDIGWVGFDPTNNTFAHDQHIRIAVGRDYRDIVPIKGVYKSSNILGTHVLDVEVHVDRI